MKKRNKYLNETHPQLLEEWNYEKNELGPEKYTYGSHKKVWWKCSKGHEWDTEIRHRSDGKKCPYCSNNKICLDNCLATINPNLSKEWHPTKNGDLTPEKVFPNSHKRAWWICKNGHVWDARINNRNVGSGCPKCFANNKNIEENCLKVKNPQLAEEWHPTKNGDLTPEKVFPNSHKRAWWICKNNHIWETAIYIRNNGHGCPECNSGSRTSFPEQAYYFYIKKHYKNTESRKIFSFNNQKYEADIYVPELNLAIEYDGGLYHRGREDIEIRKNDMFKKNGIYLIRIREPELKNEHLIHTHLFVRKSKYLRTLNEDIKNFLETLNLSKTKIDLDSDRFKIEELVNPTIKKNNLKKTHPNLYEEWDFDSNYPLTPENVTKGSMKKVWWVCKNNHKYEKRVDHRVSGVGCNICRSLKFLYPDIAKDWDYKKNDLKPKKCHTEVHTWFGGNVRRDILYRGKSHKE